jgi:pyridoxamine 5'-phosphate oxidase-like protein
MQTVAEITPEIEEFIRAQALFFVATAPLAGDGHLNLSPKGLDTFRVLSPTRVGYLDLTGSGNETAAHVSENGRITLMFCAFAGKPNILRLFGRGSLVLPGSAQWSELIERFTMIAGARQIIVCDVDRVQNSCGMAVPLMKFEGHREALVKWAVGKGEQGLNEYRAKKNRRSIDGIPIPSGDSATGP